MVGSVAVSLGTYCAGLVARTISQQCAVRVEKATSPFQYALSRAGTECVTHIVQALTDLNARTTVMSVDGIGAYELISRDIMLSALRDLDGGGEILPFVSSLYGRPSCYLWEDELGEIHDIQQGEGGEQGDALMPMLFSLGLREALVAVARQPTADEELFAFLDDIYVICSPERVGDIHFLLQQELWRHSRISLHLGKTQVWNRAGFEPPACAELQQAAEEADPDAVVWKGSQEMPYAERGVKILGTPVGDPEYVKAMLSRKTEENRVFLEHIPNVDNLQWAWLLLLFCASTQANRNSWLSSPSATMHASGNGCGRSPESTREQCLHPPAR